MKTLVNALNGLHKSSIIHKEISSRNIVFGPDDNIMIANASYVRDLEDMNSKTPFDSGFSGDDHKGIRYPISWQSPESLHDEFFLYNEKDDVFCLGRTFLEMVFGLDISRKSSLEEFLSQNHGTLLD